MESKKVLLGVSGSVAAIRVPALVAEFKQRGAEVKVLPTSRALFFLEKESRLPEGVDMITDQEEWVSWEKFGDDVVHVSLRRWADVFLIAPLSANTLAKLANGLCDNTLTCTARAWDPTEAPFLVAPAMNTTMWRHPLTARHIEEIQSFGVRVIPPVSKTLACGDTGVGAMASISSLVDAIDSALLTFVLPPSQHANACPTGARAI